MKQWMGAHSLTRRGRIADLPEGFAQLIIDGAEMPQSKTALLLDLCKLAKNATEQQGSHFRGVGQGICGRSRNRSTRSEPEMTGLGTLAR
jgi:hypothetical protein